MGSPDSKKRQLDDMGGGISSLSKIAIIAPSKTPDADIDYTFGQVSINSSVISYKGNCGNISSAVGHYAIDEGLVKVNGNIAEIRIKNTNTNKIIISRFAVKEGKAAVEDNFSIQGVAGTGSPIRLAFMDPCGAVTGKLIPTGNTIDQLTLQDGSTYDVSIIDATNPAVLLRQKVLD